MADVQDGNAATEIYIPAPFHIPDLGIECAIDEEIAQHSDATRDCSLLPGKNGLVLHFEPRSTPSQFSKSHGTIAQRCCLLRRFFVPYGHFMCGAVSVPTNDLRTCK